MKNLLRLRRVLVASIVLGTGYLVIAGCGGDDESSSDLTDSGGPETSAADTGSNDARVDARSPEYTGSACKVATDCYGDIDASSLKGAAVCIDRVENGYCTHKCQTDADCCATPGECRTGLRQVCAPFESTGDKYCFLSCEAADIASATDAGASDAGSDGNAYCENNASSEFSCRSTGGGSENRKVCLPTGTPSDAGPKDASIDVDAGL